MNIHYCSAAPSLRRGVASEIRRAFIAWLAASGAELLLSPGSLGELSTLAAMNPLRMALVGAVVFAALHFLPPRWERWAVLPAFGLSFGAVAASFTWPLLTAWLLILGALTAYAWRGWAFLPSRP